MRNEARCRAGSTTISGSGLLAGYWRSTMLSRNAGVSWKRSRPDDVSRCRLWTHSSQRRPCITDSRSRRATRATSELSTSPSSIPGSSDVDSTLTLNLDTHRGDVDVDSLVDLDLLTSVVAMLTKMIQL